MSGDGGRAESFGGAGAPDAVAAPVDDAVPGGLPARQVPAQRGGGSGAGAAELPPSDGDLIARVRAGDDGAYEDLYRRHAAAVRRYARTCCRDADTADDLTAEVFARTLQAVRGGAGPDQAVRAYLLTTVRRVAAAWTRTARREQLVEDFALFAEQAAAARGPAAPVGGAASADALGLGADARAMHEAEQTLAMRAFRSLPERWQAVLWHTTVEEASPSAIAPLFGLTPNATAVLASRAREGLKQAYLQAHVSSALTAGGDCARYADRLGAYARGGLRMRAERGLRKHLEECARCRIAAGELKDVNAGIPALLPVAVIGWFAAGYAVKAAGAVAGGAAGAAGAGAAAAATGAGTGAGGAAGASASAGGAGAGGSGAGAAAVSEGLGLPAKAAIAAGLAVATAAGVVFALTGDDPEPRATARPAPSVAPAAPVAETPEPERPTPAVVPRAVVPAAERSAPAPRRSAPAPRVTPASPEPEPSPRTSRPAARPTPPEPTPTPTPSLRPSPSPSPTRPPTTSVRAYRLAALRQSVFGDHTGPEIDTLRSSWVWQRWGVRIADRWYANGVTVHAGSAVTIDLNRSCDAFSARVGVDGLSAGPGALRFSVWADGARLWRGPALAVGDPAVPVRVGVGGARRLRLVVERESGPGAVLLGDWAQAVITCR
ncbi:sigma-70 family RNA polymerase sigma factor [Streptomyces sp. NRRL S-87]|uniref:sigma-70 family RNA polymerase sigma factor n=1 Tax=Streptomyces sp. NRRL S-87 TaxID=1463920 RepID=UPI000A76993B|nr:sigma-70 family RNA polymerase sigma factor [Streptomyces sp. NRRL S-87]